ncbi:VOC family protein [Iamia sp. SCSIO 61187]|uniref:VOC family protein n=1 Tax=Iamia sp. SCSIO 61187 TaxID=2722752 RepID=UPI001C630ADC|nr:VOC family protein [Iamia sp. SCSIO 61187]QYG95188.1 VOC family protein [Iamia sp. SCSIO 61187]
MPGSDRSTGDGTAARLVALSVDAQDPLRLARVWAAALRWEVGAATDDEVGLVPTDGTRFGIVFRRVAEPKVGKSRIHLDLTTSSLDDQRDSVAQLVALGARPIDIGQRPDEEHVVLADPEGNELCLIEPGNSFLAGCDRLGALSCDGTRAVGLFWSAALGWPLVWDQDEETAIRDPDGTGPLITWGGLPLPPKVGRNRLRLDIAPTDGTDQRAEVDRLVALGATPADIGHRPAGGVGLTDPDGNELCLLPAPAARRGQEAAAS